MNSLDPRQLNRIAFWLAFLFTALIVGLMILFFGLPWYLQKLDEQDKSKVETFKEVTPMPGPFPVVTPAETPDNSRGKG